MNQYETTGKSIIGVQQVNENETHKYGIVDPLNSSERLFSVNSFVVETTTWNSTFKLQ